MRISTLFPDRRGLRRAPASAGRMLTSALRRGRYALGTALLVAAALSLPAAAQASPLSPPPPAPAGFSGGSSLLTRAPWLTDMTTTSVQMSWATTTQNYGVVEYGPIGNCTANSVIEPAQGAQPKQGTPITVNSVTEYLNTAEVTGLSAATAYCYRITTGGSSPVDLLGTNASPQFTTLQTASGSQPMTFDVLGDWGDTTDSGVDDGSLNANQAGVDAQIAGSGAQFAISTGDIAYPGGTQTDYGDLNQTGLPDVSAVFGPSYWAVPGQSIPMYPVSGNHGKNATFLQEWPETQTASSGVYTMVNYPSIDGTTPGSYPATYYAFSSGGARFYMLDASWGDSDTGTATGGACGSPCAMYQVDHDTHWTATSLEYEWLSADLAAHPGGLKFAFFHFPLHADNPTQPSDPYLDNTPGSTGSLEQLLNQNGVNLVFNGHAHMYERNIAAPGGVTSYVTGGGGAQAEPVSGCSSTDAYAVGWSYSSNHGSACGAATAPTSDSQVYHFLKVTVNGTDVTVTPTNSTGTPFDQHVYNFAPDTTPPSAPGSLTATAGGSGTTLSWTAASDNIGVSAYDVYRDGTYLATVGPGVTSYTDATAVSGAAYTYQVTARDLAGNTTSASVPVNGGSAFYDGFETGDLSLWSGSSGLRVSSLAHTGSFGARATSTGTPVYAYRVLGGSYTSLWAQAWVYVASHTSSAGFFDFQNSTGASIASVYVNASGMLSVRNDAGSVTTYSTTQVPTGSWHLVSMNAVINGASSSFSVYFDKTQVPALTLTGQNLGTAPITRLALGDTVAGRTYDTAFDEVTVAQSSPLGDTTPPSAPTGLTATASGAGTVGLTWGASTDNVGVTSYAILRGGSQVGTVPGTATSYTDSGLVPGTQYSYQVTASDAAGNVSQPSNQATASTPSALFYDGFETDDLSQWTTVSGLGLSSLAHTGSYAARETSTGTATYAYKTLGGSYTSLWGQAWVDVVSHSTSATFFDFRASNGGSIVSVYVNPSGMLSLRNDVGSVTTYSTTPVPTGTWHLVTMNAVINGTGSSVTVFLDGTQVSALTLTGQNLGTNPITKLQLGDTAGGRTYDVALDDVTVTQTAP